MKEYLKELQKRQEVEKLENDNDKIQAFILLVFLSKSKPFFSHSNITKFGS